MAYIKKEETVDIALMKEQLRKEIELEFKKEQAEKLKLEEEEKKNKVLWGKRIILAKLNNYTTSKNAWFFINGVGYDLEYGKEYDVPLGLIEIIDEHKRKLTYVTDNGKNHGQLMPNGGNSAFIMYDYTTVGEVWR